MKHRLHPLAWAIPLSVIGSAALALSMGTTPLRLVLQILSFAAGAVAAYFAYAPARQAANAFVDDMFSRYLLHFVFTGFAYLLTVLVVYLPLAFLFGIA